MNEMVQKQPTEKYCSECGAIINAKAEICPKCGVRQYGLSSAYQGKSRIGAALFAIFLGGLGTHKFYLGKAGQGILYLVFCWSFIPSLIGFIEGIVYLTMSDDAFKSRYGA